MSDIKIHEGNHFSKYLKNAPWYLISSILTKAIGFFLIPLYTHFLSTEDYGTLSTLESFGRVLPVFLSLYLDAAFNRFYYSEKEVSAARVSCLFSTHFWFLLPWGILVSAIVLLVAPFLFQDLASISVLLIVVVITTQLLTQLAVMVTMIWNANLLAKKLSIFQVVMSLITTAATVYLMAFDDRNWESRIYALFIVAIIQFLILIVIAVNKGWLRFSFSTAILKRSLQFSVPLLPNIAAGWIAMFSDRFVLVYYDKLGEVGVYSIAAQIATLVYVVNDAITKVQGPMAMSGLVDNPDEAKKQMATFLEVYILVIGFFFIGLCYFSYELLYLFTPPEYLNAYLLMPMLASVFIFSGVYRVFTNIISFHNVTRVISIAAMLQALTNLALNFLLIPRYGMYAAAFSTMLSMIVYTAFIVYSAQKLDRINLNYPVLAKSSALIMVFLVLGLLLNSLVEHRVELFILKVFAILALLAAILYQREDMRDKVISRIKSRR